jgi:enoyl-CoA hydratase
VTLPSDHFKAPVLQAELRQGVRLLTLNRPGRLNAMSWPLLKALHAELDALEKAGDVRAVVITGAGAGFCAGADMYELTYDEDGADDSPQARLRLQRRIADLVLRLRGLPQPVIAAVNGAAVGGGFALALAADIRVIADSARFGASFVKIGLSGCDIGVSWLLPRLVGASRAFELMLSGRTIDADEAERIGLASFRVADPDVVTRAGAIAESIVANSPMGVALTKETMWSQLEVGSLRAGIDLENHTQVLATFTADYAEARDAFRQNRPPRFTDH